MANKTLAIHAKVNNAASAPLNKIQQSLKGAGAAAKQAGVDFTQFNKVMFTTSAYIGFFALSFKKFGDVIAEGAKFDRLEGQFERVMGPKGTLFKQISDFTDNSIDKVEAMRSAIAIKTLGAANDTKQVAEIIARAGTAAKNAGLESGEGIKKFTQFLKDGSVSNLEFLNLMSSQNPAFKTQMALISKYTGVLGGAMTAQAKYAIGMRVLRAATDSTMIGQRDLYDVVLDAKQAFSFLGKEIGRFFGESLKLVIDKMSKFADLLTSTLEDIRHNKKEILFLTKSVIVLTGAFAGLLAVGGTIRLLGIGLKALGVSAFPLIGIIGGVVSLFMGLTHNIKEGDTALQRFVNKLRAFAAVFQGIYQLVSSFLTDADNFEKGVGKMDKALYEFLDQKGLFKFVHNVSKVLSIVGKFGIETFKELKSWAKALDDIFSSLNNNFLSLFGVNQKLNIDLSKTGNIVDVPNVERASRKWVDANKTAYKWLVKGAGVLITAFAAKKLFGGVLSKLPVIGKYFGGGGLGKQGPSGSASDPIYVRDTSKSFIGPKQIFTNVPDKLINIIKTTLSGLPPIFFNLFKPLETAIRYASGMFSGGFLKGIGAVAKNLFLLSAAFGVVAGIFEGFKNNLGSFGTLFNSVTNAISTFDYGTLYNNIKAEVNAFALVIKGMANQIGDALSSVWISIKESSVGKAVGAATDKVTSFLDKHTPQFLKDIGSGVVSTITSPFETTKSIAASGVGALSGASELAARSLDKFSGGQILSSVATAGPDKKVTVPKTEQERLSSIDNAIKYLQDTDQAKATQMAGAYQAALKDDQKISPEEWVSIFKLSLDNAIITEEIIKTKEEVKSGNTNTKISSKRGGC